MPKPRKPLTDRQQWKNLCDALAEDALNDKTPLTEPEKAETGRVKKRQLERAESEGWTEKAKRKKGTPKTRDGV